MGNLNLTQLTTNQDAKETTINDADAVLEAFGTDTFTKDLTGLTSPYALTTTNPGAEAYNYRVYKFTGALTGTFVIEVPVDKRPYKLWNTTTGGHTVTLKTVAGTGVDATTGDPKKAVYCDGTNVVADLWA